MNVLISGFQYSQINIVRSNSSMKGISFLNSPPKDRHNFQLKVESVWWMTGQQPNLTRDVHLFLSDMQLYQLQPTHTLSQIITCEVSQVKHVITTRDKIKWQLMYILPRFCSADSMGHNLLVLCCNQIKFYEIYVASCWYMAGLCD